MKFASPQNSVLEKQLVMAERQEKDAAMAAIAEQNEAVKAQENETIAKEMERKRQTELMNRILKGGKKGESFAADEEDAYISNRSAEKKINARLERMSDGKPLSTAPTVARVCLPRVVQPHLLGEQRNLPVLLLR